MGGTVVVVVDVVVGFLTSLAPNCCWDVSVLLLLLLERSSAVLVAILVSS